jgi:hypothetical protein
VFFCKEILVFFASCPCLVLSDPTRWPAINPVRKCLLTEVTTERSVTGVGTSQVGSQTPTVCLLTPQFDKTAVLLQSMPVARYLRASLTVANTRVMASQSRYEEGGETIVHKASCSPLALPSFHLHLLWRSPGSQIFCVQYQTAVGLPVCLALFSTSKMFTA